MKRNKRYLVIQILTISDELNVETRRSYAARFQINIEIS